MFRSFHSFFKVNVDGDEDSLQGLCASTRAGDEEDAASTFAMYEYGYDAPDMYAGVGVVDEGDVILTASTSATFNDTPSTPTIGVVNVNGAHHGAIIDEGKVADDASNISPTYHG